LLKFPETLEAASDELAINKICDFIYELAGKISEGYKLYRIIDDPSKDSRILLIEAIRQVFSTAFHLVGIVPLDRIWEKCIFFKFHDELIMLNKLMKNNV